MKKGKQVKLENCYFCCRNFDQEELNKFSYCSHNICSFCLFVRIFTDYIQNLQGQYILQLSCKCRNGTLDLDMSDIFNILIDKREHEKVIIGGFEKVGQIEEACECAKNPQKSNDLLFSDYFCLDCTKWICKDCKNDATNSHYSHRVLESRYLLTKLKDIVNSMDLKYNEYENFIPIWEQESLKFSDLIDANFNKTVKKFDELIESAIKLKEYYIKEYQRQLENYVKTFKVIKLLYMNFYTDKFSELNKINVENNNIYKLRYLPNISYEFISLNLSHPKIIEEEISMLKQKLEQFKKSNFKLIEGNFIFEKVKKGFIVDELINAHNKYISSMVLLNSKIISGSHDGSIKIWDNDLRLDKYIIKQDIKYKQIRTILGLKNGKFCVSSLDSGDIILFDNKDSIDEKFNNVQTLSSHHGEVTSMIELEDGTIVSGSVDKTIIFWEKNATNFYKVKDIIKKEKKIKLIVALDDFKIAYTLEDDKTIGILGSKNSVKLGKLISSKFEDICKLEGHLCKIRCICKLNYGCFASGGADSKQNINQDIFQNKEQNTIILDHNIYIWKPFENKYTLSQTILNAHDSDINSIVLLRDGNFASASADRSIKIWDINKNKYIKNNRIEYFLTQEIRDYGHGLFHLIQLLDDRIVATDINNNIIIFRKY